MNRNRIKQLSMFFLLATFLLVSCNNSNNKDIHLKENQNSGIEKTTINQLKISEDTLSPDNIDYLGAFLLPDDGIREQEMFSYGGVMISGMHYPV